MKPNQYVCRYTSPEGEFVQDAIFNADSDHDAIGVALRRWPQGAASYSLARCQNVPVTSGGKPQYLDALLSETLPADMAQKLTRDAVMAA